MSRQLNSGQTNSQTIEVDESLKGKMFSSLKPKQSPRVLHSATPVSPPLSELKENRKRGCRPIHLYILTVSTPIPSVCVCSCCMIVEQRGYLKKQTNNPVILSHVLRLLKSRIAKMFSLCSISNYSC